MKQNWKRALVAALVMASTATAVGGGQIALAACPTRTTTTPFTAWGDSNAYFVVPGATFEGSHGTTVSMTRIASAAFTKGSGLPPAIIG